MKTYTVEIDSHLVAYFGTSLAQAEAVARAWDAPLWGKWRGPLVKLNGQTIFYERWSARPKFPPRPRKDLHSH